jgi:predicted nucleotidyltransferase
MDHRSFSRKGGLARSAAKTAANRSKIAAFWQDVREGRRPAPRRPRKPLSIEEIGPLLEQFCRANGIVRLEVFGSVARGTMRKGSDLDLIATFRQHPGLRIVEIEERLAKLAGVPVDLLTSEAVDEMTNPVRRESISRDRRTVYAD